MLDRWNFLKTGFYEGIKVVVIDVESGDYETDPDDAAATARLNARRPRALTYAVRVGHPATYRMGARL